MKIKNFLAITTQKIKVAVLIFVSFFFMAYAQNMIGQYFTPAYFDAIGELNTTIQFESSSGAMSYLLATFSFFIAFSYLLSCFIVSMFAKRGRK